MVQRGLHQRFPFSNMRSFLATALCLVALVLSAAAAVGQASGAPVSATEFDIPAQLLVDALQAYSRRSGVQVMYESSAAANLRSVPVKGIFTPDVALQKLLGESGLEFKHSRSNAVTIARAAPSGDRPWDDASPVSDLTLGTLRIRSSASAADDDSVSQYISTIRTDIQKALQRASKGHSGAYRVGLLLWIDESRTVQRAEMFGADRNPQRDAAIAAALQGLVLGQKQPANLPQPVRFMLAILNP
jgi:hypothetical protein